MTENNDNNKISNGSEPKKKSSGNTKQSSSLSFVVQNNQSSVKKVNSYVKNIKYINFMQNMVYKFSEHLNYLSNNRFIELDDYTMKLTQCDELFKKIKNLYINKSSDEIENNSYFKKNTKILLENNYPELNTQLKNLILSNGHNSVNDILNILTNNYMEENPIINDELKEYLIFLNDNFITLNINIYSDENEKIKFKNINNIESSENPIIRNLLISNIIKHRNIYEKIDGASVIIPYNNLLIICHGLFKKDSLNICRDSKIFNKKFKALNDDLDYIDVPKEFKDKYIEQLTLKDYIVNPTRELVTLIKNDYQEYLNMKSKSLSIIIKDFIKAPIERQRKILILMLMGDDESKFNANMIFDLIKSQNITYQSQSLSDLLYKSFHWKIQKIFKISSKNYEDSKKKIENLTISDIPYESRITALKTSDFVKSKALEKLKEINGSKENSNKAQQWLDGFLKIPFGVYREEPILKYLKLYQENLENFIQQFSTEIYDFEAYILKTDNKNHKKYYDILSPIINEYYGTINEKSENSYQIFIKYLIKIIEEVNLVENSNSNSNSNLELDFNKSKNINIIIKNSSEILNKNQKDSKIDLIENDNNFNFIDIDSYSPISEFDNSPDNDNSSNNNSSSFYFNNKQDMEIFKNLSLNLSFDSQKILYNLLFKNKNIDEITFEKSKEELNKFIELKEKILKNKNSNPSQESLDLLENKLKELEELILIKDNNDNDIDNNYDINNLDENNFKKFINKNKKKIQNYINDWNNFKDKKKKYLQHVENTLDKCTYGQYDAKKQMKRLIAQWMNGNNAKGSCIGLQGPPGVGKTSLLKHGLSKCLVDDEGNARPMIFVPIGGSSNGSFLEGHNYTYLGSTWGKIVDSLMEAKCMNPIIFIDELDKISKTEHGKELASILTHITDETQNHEFFDRYFASIPIDLSRVLFVFSYNDKENIDPILRDRIEEIKVAGLSKKEKIIVCKNYILPEIYKNVGFGPDEIIFSNEILDYIIESYTFESGARKIKEILLNIVRDINLLKIENEDKELPIIVDLEFINKFMLDKPKTTHDKTHNKPIVGVSVGLYALSGFSSTPGGITPIQTFYTYNGESKLKIEKVTGLLGESMKESVDVAFSLAYNLLPQSYKNKLKDINQGLHVHCGSISKKDGPSATAIITCSIFSRLTGISIRNDVASTGEADSMGNITKIGGLYSKLEGAILAGINTVVICEENEEDLDSIIRKESEQIKLIQRSSSMKDMDLSPVLNDHYKYYDSNNRDEELKKKYRHKRYKNLDVFIVSKIQHLLDIVLTEKIEFNDYL